jgi:hypothetical protein
MAELGAFLTDARFLLPGPENTAELSRPAIIPGGTWRRMSRLARMAATVAVPLLDGRTDLAELPVVWGSCVGELVPTHRFLGRLFQEGPGRTSPLSFQNSVYNASMGHLSVALGLQGHMETVCAGGTTGLSSLARGIELLKIHPAALVVAGDDVSPGFKRAFELAGSNLLLGEAMGAVLLSREKGRSINLVHGIPRGPAEGIGYARRAPMPNETKPLLVPGAQTPESQYGFNPSLGVALLASLKDTGGYVVEQDDGHAISLFLK